MGVGRTYDMGYTPDVKASVVELILDRNIVGQLTEIPDGDGFLIRLWPPNGTHEFGGNNGTSLSMVVKFEADGQMRLMSLHSDPDASLHNPYPKVTVTQEE